MDILTVISQADELYRKRTDAEAVKASVSILANMPGANGAYEVQWRLARALFFLGQEASSEGSKRQLHAAGIGAGKLASTISEDRVEGRFWHGVNLALFAQSSAGLKAATALLSARAELKKSAAICESYHDAGPLRVLGRLEHKAPWFLGGSLTRGRYYFERALALAPANSVTLFYAAELALAMRETERASALLNRIMILPADPEWEAEIRRDSQAARLLLEKLDNGEV